MKNTKLLSDSENDLKYAADLLKKGQVVGIPTETVYGLGADALNPEAVKAVFKAKGRPADNPLIVHIGSIETTETLAHDIPELFFRLAEHFWSGPLTMIVPKNSIVPDVTTGGLDTVALRMPSHPVMQRLIALSGPVAAPSANTSGYPSPTMAEHVIHDMNGKIPAVIDGGACDYGVESTVICFENDDTVRVLRPGSITPEMLGTVAGNVIVDDAVIHDIKKGVQAISPGMKYRHYSPKADIFIAEGSMEKFCNYAKKNTDKNTFCLIPDGDAAYNIPCPFITYGTDSRQQAHSLFAKLRELDDMGAEKVLVRPPSTSGEGLAVYNRLLRAAGFEVISL